MTKLKDGKVTYLFAVLKFMYGCDLAKNVTFASFDEGDERSIISFGHNHCKMWKVSMRTNMEILYVN